MQRGTCHTTHRPVCYAPYILHAIRRLGSHAHLPSTDLSQSRVSGGHPRPHPYHPSRRCEGAATNCCHATGRTWTSTSSQPSSLGLTSAETVSSGIIAHRARQPRRRCPSRHDPDDCGTHFTIATARTACSGTHLVGGAGSCGDESCPSRQEPGWGTSRAPRSRHRSRASTGIPTFHPCSGSPWFGEGCGHRLHTARS